ncbi:MAG: ATP-binding protein [Planctomycetota bacterium]|jgi:serine/threonine-protein kinase RsbW
MASKLPIRQSLVVQSKSTAIEGVCKQILAELGANEFTEDNIFAVHLALEEAFVNAVTHGNKMDPDKKVRIEYLVNGDKIEISLTDQGDGFDANLVPDPRWGDNLYKTGGRGLFLIRSYMDIVEFNERGNRIRMVKHKGERLKTEDAKP